MKSNWWMKTGKISGKGSVHGTVRLELLLSALVKITKLP